MEGFETNVKLRALYIQENVFDKIENLNHLKELHYLNLSDNYIATIENLGEMPNLGTLQLKKNRVGVNGLSDVMGLLEIPTLSVLDLSENNIDDEAIVDEVLVKMPELKVLYLKGNPVCKKIKFYKKSLISRIKTLRYLDDSPVFPEDRRYAEAWAQGGLEKEREERKIVKKEKDDAHWKNHEAFREMIRKAREEKKKSQNDASQNDQPENDQTENVAQDSPVEELKFENKKIEQVENLEGDESEEVIETTKEGVKKQDQKDKLMYEAKENKVETPEKDDLPPELEEVSEDQIAAEHQKSKVHNLINQLKDPENGQTDSVNKSSNGSVVDVNDIQVENSNSIKVSSVTSENSDNHRIQSEEPQDHNLSYHEKSQQNEEEKHLDDSASEPDEESAKTEPNQLQQKLSSAEAPYVYESPATKLHEDDGEYLDELD